MKGEITHLAPLGQQGSVLPASAKCVHCAGRDTKPVHIWPSGHLPWMHSEPGRPLPMPTPTRWLTFQGESASPGLSCRLPSGGAPESGGGRENVGWERRDSGHGKHHAQVLEGDMHLPGVTPHLGAAPGGGCWPRWLRAQVKRHPSAYRG